MRKTAGSFCQRGAACYRILRFAATLVILCLDWETRLKVSANTKYSVQRLLVVHTPFELDALIKEIRSEPSEPWAVTPCWPTWIVLWQPIHFISSRLFWPPTCPAYQGTSVKLGQCISQVIWKNACYCDTNEYLQHHGINWSCIWFLTFDALADPASLNGLLSNFSTTPNMSPLNLSGHGGFPPSNGMGSMGGMGGMASLASLTGDIFAQMGNMAADNYGSALLDRVQEANRLKRKKGPGPLPPTYSVELRDSHRSVELLAANKLRKKRPGPISCRDKIWALFSTDVRHC